MNFKLNDEVKWSSSSNGVTKVKIGVIVEVIPAGVNVRRFELGRQLDAPGLPRKEESYIVCVGPKPGSRAKPKYYWPRVNALRHLHNGK
ncbi:hypothetical protein BS424_17360 [Cronobacter sakazakii]|nr:hypothetical protein CDT91_04655 [Cronobacter sakazakii]PUX19813.1 hypothetical protein BS410_22560 [Cronobacter sakazakii]PUX43948.1 hypothetical protein BS424_17360 [Cronobacter sakazakii]